ncbi:30S ribosomal protein S6 [Thermodesulfobacteriota bacterium]
MRRYEVIFIVDPELSEEGRQDLFGRIGGVIEDYEGFVVHFDEWGTRKLAYVIKKKPRGYYVRVDMCGTPGLVTEMERVMRIDDRVLKYLTVLVDAEPDIEALRGEATLTPEEKEKTESREEVAEESTEHDEAVVEEANTETQAPAREEEK